ncbi:MULTISPECIES: hypothetical protein [Brevundimonas]|uniref:Uncharacterized protein n=1 Tax=Brevundimonas nasdae TaxID=172043 RepID=A0ACD4VMB5_9CAUL|nr:MULTISPECIES: hypothetical protein [Brevundimonas]WOB79206.1 hypothetical protein PZA08_03310 [Brevundimonas nasdae]
MASRPNPRPAGVSETTTQFVAAPFSMKSHRNTTDPEAPASSALGGISILGGSAHTTGGSDGAGAVWTRAAASKAVNMSAS